jgi:phosphoglycerate dehydrogenase-like enzyme
MKSFAVVRVNLSPYHHPDFMRMEQELLERIPGIKYQTISDLSGEEEIILITNTHTILKDLPETLLKRTQLILHPNSGYDHFAEDALLWKDIPIVVGHKIRSQAVAEYTLGCLFEGLLETPQHINWNKQRQWKRPLLKDLSVCLFGYGHIGKIIAQTLSAIGMEVTVIDPFLNGFAKSWREIDLKKMKVVLSCMSFNSTSAKLFNHNFFKHAHEELLFINGARGGLVDEIALREFLLSHPKAFAFLDVFEQEPFTEQWQHFPQVWKTSHIAGVYQRLDQGILDFECEVLIDYLNLSADEFKKKYHKELLQNKWYKGELI